MFSRFLSSKEKKHIQTVLETNPNYDPANVVADMFVQKRACDSREDLIAQQLSERPPADKKKVPRFYIAYSHTTNQSFMKVGVSATEKSKHLFRLKSVHSGHFTVFE